jgi:V/A-type H+-transporting ATPase subunit D
VQIPGFQDAIRKIKRFMEDEENLSKSSQKIVKSKREAEARMAEELAKNAAIAEGKEVQA